MIIGLTGRTGSGKSTAASFLKDENFVIVDFDSISRETTKKGSLCMAELEEYFGPSVISKDGELNRKLLAEIVFSDPKKLAILNKITHKYILRESEKICANNKEQNIVFDAPLLFEAGLEKQCDYVIGVIAPIDESIKRICKRDGIDRCDAIKRINNQKSDSFFRENCDFIVENNKNPEHMRLQIQNILRSIFNESAL